MDWETELCNKNLLTLLGFLEFLTGIISPSMALVLKISMPLGIRKKTCRGS